MDDDVLGTLYQSYHPELIRTLTRRFPWSGDLVEDAVQTAFLKLHGADPVPDQPRAWLYTVARHHVIDRLHEQGRFLPDDDTIAEVPANPATLVDSSGVQLPSPTLVQRALLLLTSRAQRLLRGKYEEGKTYGTLARQEGVAKGSMGRLLDRARQRLRRAVDGMRS